jgi:hypothetical protein
MLAKVEAWRQRHLVDGYPPDTREPWEIMQLARWRWPVKGPKRAATEEEAELIADLLRWKLERKELEEAEKHARAKLAVSMAHHQQVWTVAAVASFNKNNALTVK